MNTATHKLALSAVVAIALSGCATQSGKTTSPGYNNHSGYVPVTSFAAAMRSPGFYPGLSAPSENELGNGKSTAYELNQYELRSVTLDNYINANRTDIAQINDISNTYRRGNNLFPGCFSANLYECVAGITTTQIVSTSTTLNFIDRQGGLNFTGHIYPIRDVRSGTAIFARDKVELRISADERGKVEKVSLKMQGWPMVGARTDGEFDASGVYELFSSITGRSCNVPKSVFYQIISSEIASGSRSENDRFRARPEGS